MVSFTERKVGAAGFLGALALLFLCGCTVVQLSGQEASPLNVQVRDFQPIAVLPVPDIPNNPNIAAQLFSFLREDLTEKGYRLVPVSVVNVAMGERSVSGVSPDPTVLKEFAKQTRAKLILVVNILDYRTQKSYLSSGTFQVWNGSLYDYEALPTWHQGLLQIRVALKLLDPEKNEVVWSVEGQVQGPTGTQLSLLRRLVQRTLQDFHPLSTP
jgi:hypothetical protein